MLDLRVIQTDKSVRRDVIFVVVIFTWNLLGVGYVDVLFRTTGNRPECRRY